MIITTVLPCLTKPFILLLLLGYLCTIYTQINITVQTKLLSLQKFINLASPDIPFLWLSGISMVGAIFYSIYFLQTATAGFMKPWQLVHQKVAMMPI